MQHTFKVQVLKCPMSSVQSVTRFERFIDNMFVLFDSVLAFTSSIKSGNSFPW